MTTIYVLVKAGNFGSETTKRGGNGIEFDLFDHRVGLKTGRVFVDHVVRSEDAQG